MAVKMVEEQTIISERFHLEPQDVAKWLANQKAFLAPLGLFYLSFVIANVGINGIALTDFVPNNATIAAMVLYVLNALYDLLRKWAGEKTYNVPVNG